MIAISAGESPNITKYRNLEKKNCIFFSHFWRWKPFKITSFSFFGRKASIHVVVVVGMHACKKWREQKD
jgi:hypothetical protein